MAVGRTEAHDEQVGIVVAHHLEVGNGNLRHLLCAQTAHQVVVLGVGRDGAGLAVFLQSAQDVVVALHAGDGPVAHLGLLVAEVRGVVVLHLRRDVVGMNLGQAFHGGQLPCTRTVGDECIGEQDDRSEVLQRNLGSLVGSVEAVGRTGGGDDRHGAFAVAAVEGLQQVGLFTLGGQTRRGTAALHVDDDQWQLVDDSQIDGLALQADAGAGGRCGSQCTGERCAYGTGTSADLVFTLDGDDAARLVLRQLVQDIGSGSDRIRTEEETQTGFLGGGNQAVRGGLVAGDVHVASRHLLFRLDAVGGGHARVGVVTVVITSLNHLDVILCNSRLLGKLLTQEIGNEAQVAVEQPAHQTQGKHIAALQDGLVVHACVFQAVLHHRGQWAGHHAVGVDAHLAEVVVGLEGSFLQVFRTKRVGVDDNRSLRLSIAVLRLERGGIHRHEHVAEVARGVHLTCTNVHLKTRDTGERALRGADVSGIVGEC